MIVEFAGAPGAGKTTLAAAVLPMLDRSLTSGHLSPGVSLGQTARNALHTPRSLFTALVRGDSRNILFTSWHSSRGRTSLPWRLARCAAAARRIADHYAMSARADQIHIVDEGVTGLVALAVAGGDEPFPDVMDRISLQIPRPDLTIIVRGEIEMITSRNLVRRDPPREWNRLSPHEIASRVRMVQDACLRLLAEKPSREVMIISSPRTEAQTSEAARRIAAAIETRWLERE